LIWDIEVSPNIGLFWRAGFDQSISYDQIIAERKIICICWKWVGEPKVHALTWDEEQDDATMLRKFSEVIESADEAVAHFGDRFDLPWIRARMIHLGLPPLPKIKTVDTKAWASKNFSFNSNKLDYLGEFLGFGKKIKTEYSLWKDILLEECPVAMDKMVRYCKRDVALLEKVYLRLADWCTPKSHAGVLGGLDNWTDPRTGSTNVIKSKTRITASGTVQHQMKNCETGTYYSINDAAFRRYLEAKVPVPAKKRNGKG
jgi:hypothetical protein